MVLFFLQKRGGKETGRVRRRLLGAAVTVYAFDQDSKKFSSIIFMHESNGKERGRKKTITITTALQLWLVPRGS